MKEPLIITDSHLGLSTVSMVAPPVFAHVVFKWVLTGFQVEPMLLKQYGAHTICPVYVHAHSVPT